MNNKPKLVILGSGFGGLYTIRNLMKNNNLGKFDVTLIDRNNYFLFTPLLHEVASGNLDAEHVITPLRQILDNRICLCIGEIETIDTNNKKVKFNEHEIKYDYLVIATGGETIQITKAYTNNLHTLKSIKDATSIKNALIDKFEKANLLEKDQQSKLLSITIIGAGATGVELSAEIVEFVYGDLYCRYHNIDRNSISVKLLSSNNTILSNFSEKNQNKVIKHLKKAGLGIIFDSKVVEINNDKLILETGNTIDSSTIIWTAGVVGSIPDSKSIKRDNRERGVINEYLQTTEHNEVFILGDAASGNPLDAQTAVQQAKVVSNNLIASLNNQELKAFEYKSKGTLASIGSKYAVGEIAGFSIAGRWVWFLWRTIYLFKMVSWRKRISVATNWTLNLFSERDISKIDL